MKTRTTLTLFLSLAIGAGAAFSLAGQESEKGDGPTLEWIHRLVGEWVLVGEDGEATDSVQSRVRVTAGGSAVHETLFPGTDHEMITLYHQDGDALVLTHYCVMGNQPHMEALASSTRDKIQFACRAGSELEKEQHMHEGTLEFVGEDRLKSTWNAHLEGEVVHTASFDLVRRTEP